MRQANPGCDFRVIASHDFEHLSVKLLNILKTPLEDPLAQELVVVPSKGLARWLSLKIAKHDDFKVCANINFLLPTELIWETCRQAFPELPERSPFALDVLSLRLLQPLSDLHEGKYHCAACSKSPGCACQQKLSSYLKGESDESIAAMKRYGLAVELAHIYERYLTHRSRGLSFGEKNHEWNWTDAWQQGKCLGLGEDESWQQAIWQQLAPEGSLHLASAVKRFCRLPQGSLAEKGLPQRVIFFGLATLPLLYLDFIEALQRHLQVHALFFSPCQEFWGDLKKWEETNHRLEGRPFSPLALWGRHGQPLFNALIEKGWLDYAPEDFPVPEGGSLLHGLQRHILSMAEPLFAQAEHEDWQSMIIQSASTPRREVEILFDTLLDRFAQDKNLSPDDVLVLVSDLRRYAPHIEAVFASKQPSIPYSIADFAFSDEKNLIDGFLHLLAVQDNRLNIDWVLDFLEIPALCRRFELSDADVALIRSMATDANIRWGYDQTHRERLEMWPTSEHTFRHGALRYLYGFAGLQKAKMENGVDPVISPLPLGSFEAAETLGKWMMLVDMLHHFASALAEKRSLMAWADFLAREKECFFLGDEKESRPLIRLLRQFRDAAKLSEIKHPLPFEIVKSWIFSHAPQASTSGLFQGGVTFSAMMAERIFPKKIIALLGMGIDDFPKKENRLSFDLLSPGVKDEEDRRRFFASDPNRDEEERYFFLQNVLAARDCLYISYIGEDAQSGEEKAPSVVVSELIDWLQQQTSKKNWVRKHPALAYDAIYFQDPFFTYDESVAKALNSKNNDHVISPFWDGALDLPSPLPAEKKEIELDALIAFFKNPSQAFLKCWEIYLPYKEEVPQGREPFGEPKGLEKLSLRQAILKDQFDQLEEAHSKACSRSKGLLPHGVIGDQIFSAHWEELQALSREIHHQGVGLWNFEFELDGWRIYGRLPIGKNNGIVTYHHDKPKAGNKLTLWLQHLALCASDHSAKEGVLLYLEKAKFNMIKLARQDAPKAKALLSQLLEEYQKGLRNPLCFFPKSALAYHENIQTGQDAKDAVEKIAADAAKKTWHGNDHQRGESEDLWHRYLYRSPDPFADEGFMNLAQKIFQPYHEALVKENKNQGKQKPGKKPPDAR